MPTVGELKHAMLAITGCLNPEEFVKMSQEYRSLWEKLNGIGGIKPNAKCEIPGEDYRVLFDEFMALIAKGDGNVGQEKKVKRG